MSLIERYAKLESERANQEDIEYNLRYSENGEKMYVMSDGSIIPKSDFQPSYSYGYDWDTYRVGRPPIQTNSYRNQSEKMKYKDDYYFD